MNKLIIHIVIFFSVFAVTLSAQSKRSLINDGVDLYKNNKFADAESNFKKGLEKDFETFEGHFNLGDALYKQQKYEDAIKSYQNALAFSQTENEKSKVYHNIGNALLKSEKLKEGVEAYKNALKLNPDDLETKYNLSYALNQMKQQQQQDLSVLTAEYFPAAKLLQKK